MYGERRVSARVYNWAKMSSNRAHRAATKELDRREGGTFSHIHSGYPICWAFILALAALSSMGEKSLSLHIGEPNTLRR